MDGALVAGRARRRTAWRWLGLLPFLLFALVFGVYPLSQVVRMAFSVVGFDGGQVVWTPAGLDNFATVLAAPLTWTAFANTAVFVVGGVAGSVVLGVAFALLVNHGVRMVRVARNVLIWPAVVAPVIVSLMWLLVLSPTAGVLNKALEAAGFREQTWLDSGFTAMLAVIAVDIWHWTPVVFIFIYTALQTVDHAVIEAARIDGATERQVIRRVVLPLIARAIAAVAIVRVVMCVRAFDEMYMLTAGGPNNATTLVSQRITQLFFGELDYGAASALGLVVVVATSVVLGVLMCLRSRVPVIA